MPATGEKRTYSQYLDLEAAVGDEGDDSVSESESGSDTDFITDDVSAPQDRPITPIEPADPEDELEALRAIARDIESRAPRLGFGRPSTMDLGITSKTYDVSLSENNFWRVRVKKGNESRIVSAIREKKKAGANIIAAFSRAVLRGSIYVIAKDPLDVQLTLEGIGGIYGNQRSLRIELIPENQRLPLLQLSESEMLPEIKKESWVRIKRGGLYRHRVAFVLSVGEEECQVLLARRYKPNKRRKEYDEDDNLIEKTYSIADLSSGFVNPTKPEIDDFKGSKHPAAALALHTWSTPLNMDDRVQVVAGSLRGLKGVVSYIGEQTITLQPSTENVAPVDVLFSDVRKYFLQGDFVRIMHGPNEGEEGFILDIDEVRALLYKPGPSGQPGIEALIDLDYIDFPDNASASLGPEQAAGPSTVKARRSETYTGEPYRNMEVLIIRGSYKGSIGRVLASFEVDGHLHVNVEPWSMGGNFQPQRLRSEHVIEHSTRLPIQRARWIRRGFQVWRPPSPPPRGLTPPPPEGSEPLFPMQQDDEEDLIQLVAPTPAPVPEPQPGEWLFNPKFLGKWLCVCVQGTPSDYYNRLYKGQVGSLHLDRIPPNVDDSIYVKLGANADKRRIRFRYLHPLTITGADARGPVIIIGPDASGSTAMVGFVGLMIPLLQPPPGMGYVVLQSIPSMAYLFPEGSICRSSLQY